MGIVCRRWRSIVLSCSQLWSTIIVTDRDSLLRNKWAIHKFCQRLEAQLDRAASGVLEGTIDVYHLEEEYSGVPASKLEMRATLLRIISQIHRFSSLHLNGNCLELDLLPSIPPTFSHLQDLSVFHPSWFDTGFLRNTPILRHFRTNGVPMAALHALHWTYLSVINIEDSSAHLTALLDAFRAANNVTTLCMELIERDDPGVEIPHTTSVQLAKLHKMELAFYGWSPSDSCVLPHLLGYIRTPHLQELDINDCSGDVFHVVQLFLFSSRCTPMLTRLHIQTMFLDQQHTKILADLLPDLLSLKSLSVGSSLSSSDDEEDELVDIDAIVDVLNEPKHGSQSQSSIICPLLEEMEFTQVAVSFRAISQLLETRSPAFIGVSQATRDTLTDIQADHPPDPVLTSLRMIATSFTDSVVPWEQKQQWSLSTGIRGLTEQELIRYIQKKNDDSEGQCAPE